MVSIRRIINLNTKDDMIRFLNVLRLTVFMFLPLIAALHSPVAFFAAILLLLYVSNVLDDIIFYYGSGFVNTRKYRGGLASPVEGVVTMIENKVPLFHHLHKKDYLTGKELFSNILINDGRKDDVYNHSRTT